MSKHTPGPWHADPGRRVTGFAVTHDGEPNPIAIALRKPRSSHTNGITDSTALANARLIAAAPDLLVALEACEELLSAMPTLGGIAGLAVVENARAAIAKARGET